MPRYVLEHRPGTAWVEGVPYTEQPGIMDHLSFMHSLAERGILLAGGPFKEAGGASMVGMAIIEVEHPAAAEALAAGDASVRSGLLRVEVREWNPRVGRWLGD